MANPSPSNLLGIGGGQIENLKPFGPNRRPVGRPKGTMNRLPGILLELYEAAAELGYVRQGLAVDRDGNPEVGPGGEPTGRMEWVPSGEGGLRGYFKWLGVNNSTAFVAWVKSMTPHQVNLKTEKVEPEPYRTVEDIKAELNAAGVTDDKIAILISDLLSKQGATLELEANVNSPPEAKKPSATTANEAILGEIVDDDGGLVVRRDTDE